MDAIKFKNLDLETQVILASSEGLYNSNPDAEEIKEYILKNPEILSAISTEALDNNYFFAALPNFLQDRVVYDNLNAIKSFAESKQRAFISDVNSKETYRYLFSYLVLINKLEILGSNEIIGFMRGIKDFEIFKKVYHKPEIFNRLMSKSKLFDSLEGYYYLGFSRLPLEYQAYILADLKTKETYAAQYAELYARASSEARGQVMTEKPNDFVGLIDYYLMTKDPSVKNDIFAKLPTYDFNTDSYEKVLNNYPEFFSLEDMEEFFKRTNVGYLLQKSSYLEVYNNDESLKELVVGKIFSAPYVPVYVIGSALSLLNEKEQRELLDKTEKTRLLESSDNPIVLCYLLDHLGSNSKYLNGVIDMNLPEVQRPSISTASAAILSNYLSPAERVYYLGADKLDVIMHEIDEDPRLIVHISTLTLLSWLNAIPTTSYLYSIFPINKLVSCMSWHLEDEIGHKIKEEFIARGRTSDIGVYDFKRICPLLTSDDKRSLLLDGNPLFFLDAYSLEKNPEFKKAWIDAIIARQDEIFQKDAQKNHWYEFLKLPDEDLTPVLGALKTDALLRLYEVDTSAKMEAMIYHLFEKDNYIFNDLEDMDSFIYSLTKEHQRKIFYEMQNQFLTIGEKDERLYSLLDGISSYSMFRFIKRYNDGFFEDKNRYDAFVHLLSQSPFLISTINYDMLSEEFLSLNPNFLEKVVRYPDIQARILAIKAQNTKSFAIFMRLMNLISLDEAKVFDRKILILLAQFEKNTYVFDHELSDQELDNLLRYILLSSKIYQFSEKSLDVTGMNPLTYAEDIEKICDEELQKANSEYDLKNIIFKKFFDISYEDARCFLYTYDNNLDSLDLDPDVRTFVENIRLITSLRNIRQLKKIYRTFLPRYSINELFIIENELQKAFANAINDSLFKEMTPNAQIKIGDKMVDVIDPGYNFKILIHSTNAYSSMPMVDDNYYTSWNANTNVNNHGICTALISDICLGFTPLKDEKYGVIFGFNKLPENGVSAMAPYDLASANDKYEVATTRAAKFMNAEGLEENTVHTHCEVVVERRTATEETGNVQPDYVIITSEMSENQKANSLAAARQMNDGKGIPIVYIDIAKIVARKKIWILGKLNNFKMYHRIEEFKEALSVYESIKCTLFTVKNYDFIKTEYMDNYINSYIEYCSTLEPTDKIKSLMDLEEALNYEKAKFDLMVDAGNRFRSLDIDYSGFIEKIYANLSLIDLKNDEEELESLASEFNLEEGNLRAHDNSHMLRVTMLASKIASLRGLDETSLFIISEAAKNHDKGRTDDYQNAGHGQRGAELYWENANTPDDIKNMVCAMIEYHEPSDNDSVKETIFDKYNIPMEKRDYLESLCHILKDADALDRVRFTNSVATLDPKKLRTKEAKLLIKYAKDLYARTSNLGVKRS